MRVIVTLYSPIWSTINIIKQSQATFFVQNDFDYWRMAEKMLRDGQTGQRPVTIAKKNVMYSKNPKHLHCTY